VTDLPDPGADPMPATLSEQVATCLSRPAVHQQWENDYRTPENEAFYELAFDALVRTLQPPPEARILDAGCGIGAHSVRLARRGFRVQAVDFSETVLDAARANVEAQGLADRIELQRGSLMDLSFPDGSFPYVLCWGVLMHIPDVERALNELARVVTPGGTLIISETNMHSLQSVAFRALKRVFRRERAKVLRTPKGLEFWYERDAGRLVTREADPNWLIDQFDRLGLELRQRRAGQFTEAYTRVPTRPLRKLVHVLNRFWFRRVRWAGPAFGNLLLFEKTGRAPSKRAEQ
jgi:ubiquinone/menaquinone biosynthesis C-methylase UbiE